MRLIRSVTIIIKRIYRWFRPMVYFGGASLMPSATALSAATQCVAARATQHRRRRLPQLRRAEGVILPLPTMPTTSPTTASATTRCRAEHGHNLSRGVGLHLRMAAYTTFLNQTSRYCPFWVHLNVLYISIVMHLLFFIFRAVPQLYHVFIGSRSHGDPSRVHLECLQREEPFSTQPAKQRPLALLQTGPASNV